MLFRSSLITVCEGKYHQVRRMMASRGMPVSYLERRREGGLSLGNLPRGSVRELTREETAALEAAASERNSQNGQFDGSELPNFPD